MGESGLNVEVVYATPDQQWLVRLDLPASATAEDAISGALAAGFPAIDVSHMPVGIWGRLVERTQRLKDGDRVELYRPLLRDPREARRDLAAAGKSMNASRRKDPG